MNTPKMRMNLDESNDLRFSLSIKGSTSDPNTVHPKMRFLVTEANSGVSMAFPMERKGDGMVGVTIPSLPHMFHEGSEYVGNVEVIVGTRWFNPTTVNIVFERGTAVEAAPILAEKTVSEEVKELEVDSVIKPLATIPAPRRAAGALSEDVALNVLFTERKEAARALPAPAQKKVLSAKLQNTKNELKKMLQEAWCEFE